MTNETTVLWSGWSPDNLLDATRVKVEKMARRAEHIGFPPPVLTVGEPSERLVYLHSQDTRGRRLAGHDLTVTAPGPLQLDGWTLVAVLELAEGDGERLTLLRKLPDSPEVPAVYRETSPDWCDHCRSRRDRRQSFLVVRDGEWRQVGSTCIKDFLGHSAAELVAWFGFLADLAEDPDWTGSGACELSLTTAEVLTTACQVVVAYGWVPKSKAEPGVTIATAARVADIIEWRPGNGDDPSRALDAQLDAMPGSAERIERLRDATSAALEAIGPDDSDWAWSLGVLWRAKRVTPRQLGLFVSAVVLGLRAQERQATVCLDSTPMGVVGERFRGLRAGVLYTRTFNAEWSPRTMVKMRVDGHDLIWWASRLVDATEGDTLVLDATVKAHETDRYTGQPVTVLTNATVREVIRKECP